LAEVMLNHLGRGRLRAWSAGSQPTGAVNPRAFKTLEAMGMSAEGVRSKSWEEFARDDAPRMDAVVTVCDNAANETCPIWPGRPARAHWGVADPASVEGSETDKLRAFGEAAATLRRRIEFLLRAPVEALDEKGLGEALRDAAPR
jgi:protein-tyrosine-phosphatase